jgi:hypothetical protein
MRILGFILDHWKAFIIGLIVVLSLSHYLGLKRALNAAKSETIVAKKALIEHIEIDSQAAKKREAENKLNAILAQKKTDAEIAKHKAQLSLIISKGKQNEILSNSMLNARRDGLQLAIQREADAAKRLLENDTDRLAERNGNADLLKRVPDTELSLCKEAGAIAAADYNLCKAYVDSQQSIIGVENE